MVRLPCPAPASRTFRDPQLPHNRPKEAPGTHRNSETARPIPVPDGKSDGPGHGAAKLRGPIRPPSGSRSTPKESQDPGLPSRWVSGFGLRQSLAGPLVPLLLLSLAGLPEARAQILITRWDFNGGSLTPASGSGEARIIGGTSATFAAGRDGEPSGGWNLKGFPSQGSAPGTAGVEFLVPTGGAGPVSMTFQIRHSNTSANTERVLWSSDGVGFTEAARFTGVPAASGTGETWYDRTVVLPPESAHPAQLLVRVVSDFGLPGQSHYVASRLGSTYSPSGTWRFDNVSFSAVPEPEEYAALGALGLVGFAAWRRHQAGRPGSRAATSPEEGLGRSQRLAGLDEGGLPGGRRSQPGERVGRNDNP